MNYKKHYIKLIRKAQARILSKETYKEEHHIWPKSIFGENKSLVKLTAYEHYVAHHLLWKYYQKRYGNFHNKTIKMCNAFWHMSNRFLSKEKKLTSRTYAIAREQYSKDFGILVTERWKDKAFHQKMCEKVRGENNPMFGKKHSKESIEKNREANTGPNHNNWNKKASKEHCEKISKALKGRVFSESHRENLGKALKGKQPWLNRKHSEESKRKISEFRKKFYRNKKLLKEAEQFFNSVKNLFIS